METVGMATPNTLMLSVMIASRKFLKKLELPWIASSL